MDNGNSKQPDSVGLWHSPAVHPLSEDKVREISDSLRLGCSQEEIAAYTEHVNSTLASYQRVHELVGSSLPVKYPRTPGYRPTPEENTHNAWYYKCEIKGAATGKLAGKRVGIKDNTAVAGVPMMNGSKILEGYVPDEDATVVTRILDAGGIIAGKTSCVDLCCGGGGFMNSMAPVLNPFNTEHMSSGSSSGSAALLALGEIDLATGGDQGGSVRLPACWCGVVGLKPTYGLVPYTGCMPIEYTLDHCGPMARNVHDCALLLEVMAGYDEGRDPRQTPNMTVPEYSKLLTEDLTGKRVALLKEGFDISSEDVRNIVTSSAQSLREVGATVEEVSLPAHNDGVHLYKVIGKEGSFQTMIKDCGHTVGRKGHYSVSLLDKLSQGYATRPLDFSEPVRMLMILGEYMKTCYHGRFYAKAQNLSKYLKEQYDKVLADYDVIIMPTIPYTAQKIPRSDSTLSERLSASLSHSVNTAPFDVTGHPSLSINAGFSEGLPVGMMITGKMFDDVSILQVAHAYEKLRDNPS